MNLLILRYLSKVIFITLLLLVNTSCIDSTKTKNEEHYSVLFNNITTIDAEFGERRNQYVLITGNKIINISKKAIVSPSNCIIVDGKGKYLIPGLWDTHVHLTYSPELEKSMFPLFLANGITSVRDTGGLIDRVLYWRDKSKKNPNSSPNVFISGPLLDGIPNVYDGSPGRPEISVALDSPEAVRNMIDSLQAKGVDFLKSYEMLTPEEFKTVISYSKKRGLFVTGHVPLSMDVIEASNEGLRSMEHLRNLEMACSVNFDSLLNARKKMLAEGKNSLGGMLRSQIHKVQRLYAIESYDEKRANTVLKSLAENGTWQIPTLALLTGDINRLYENDTWKETFQYLPPEIRSNWIKKAEEKQQKEINHLSIAYGQWGLKMITKLKDANVKILAGTDTPISFLTPGFSLHKELEILVKSGLTPMEVLESATILPAKYFGLEDVMGTIDINKAADLVLLDANPLNDIKNTNRISGVVRNGIFYNRKALDNLLKKASGLE
ncbi:hydrolase [Flavobacteriaceae bacterium PRS1]|nr:hydrolase [Flavobacteriaceae bacterium PRS1]